MRTVLFLAVPVLAMAAATALENEIAAWRETRLKNLKSETGWLTVTGLFWLRDGANRFGTGEQNEIRLTDGPERAGVFELRNGKVSVTMDGKTRPVANDQASDFVAVGRLKMFVIKRGDRIGIRLRDPDSKYGREFHGIEYFPVAENFRVTARFVAEPKKIPILNVLGQTEDSENPGYVVFKIRGKEMRLYPIIETPGDTRLFFIFKDQTSGKQTYPAGRFMYTDMPKDGVVTLDFNKAYNPPCAFTPYATCPLPPKSNHLAFRIEAGEKAYHFD